MTPVISGPAWDNSSEYPSLTSPELLADFDEALKLVGEIAKLGRELALHLPNAGALPADTADRLIETAREISALRIRAVTLLHNVSVFAHCESSVDAANADAKRLITSAQALGAKLAQAVQPADLFLTLVPDALIDDYLSLPQTAFEEFEVRHRRKLRDQLLSLEEENLISALGVDGHTAWGNLYTNLASTLTCEVELPGGTRKMGVASANGLLQGADGTERQAAWHAVNAAWTLHEEACAAALNALAGWRLEVDRRRSKKAPVHFLASSLHDNRLEKRTLDALMAAVAEESEVGRHALRLRAKALGKARMDPWDLLASPPARDGAPARTYPYEQGLAEVERAFQSFHPDMGGFVRMMNQNRWIEGRVNEGRRPGAYCTKFTKSRSPRVYMTYMGGLGHVGTLAHELGHAFHNWVMRDLPLSQVQYPMALAETASIFAETLLTESMAARATNPAELFPIGWEHAQNAYLFLIDIPTRFGFEKKFYERRRDRTLTARDLTELMRETWLEHAGDAVSEPNSRFWSSKLHFYISGLRFYNFPYTFGYLFALGVYARREKLGADFYQSYVSLLRDTGRMTAEEVAKKHLDADLGDPAFWRESLAVVRRRVNRFEEMI